LTGARRERENASSALDGRALEGGSDEKSVLVFLVGVGFLLAAPFARAGGGIDGTGSVGTCPAAGKIAIKPGLVNGGTTPDTLKVKTKTPKLTTCSGGTGDGAHVVSASSKGTGTGANNDCASLSGPTTSNLTLVVKWKTDGTVSLNPSTITLTSQTGGVSGNRGTFDVTGTVTAGSFQGDNVSAHIVTDPTLGEILTACGGKGLKKISFGSKASKADGMMGSGSVTIN
jgi:hypothetical protein